MLRESLLAAAIAAVAPVQAWLPEDKIRGVNVGSMFVFEPWIDQGEWSNMGCGGTESEFDCVSSLGQEAANTAFQNHYRDWITESDLDEMASYGLNTIRVPLGYWLMDDIVDSSEQFPRGALDRLTEFVGQASDRNFYIIIDLHGGPGAQVANQPFTGQVNPNADFYNDYNYGRAVEWLRWMTEIIHTTDEFRGAGMLQVLNEPLHWEEQVDSLRSQFYVDAYTAIREVESNLNVAESDRVHIQMMSELWGSGNPTQYLPDTTSTAFDDHRYLKWDGSVSVNKENYISTSCSDDRNAEEPLIIGEWSLSVPDDVEWSDDWNPFNDSDFYSRWFSAQIQTYERSTKGWVFWTWKANVKFGDERGDPRWSYRDAVTHGLIPSDVESALSRSVC